MGRFSGNNRNTSNVFSGRITCLTIVGGNQAWFAGVIENSNFPGQIDQAFGWRAQDGPDKVTFGFFIGNPADAIGFCDSMPTDSPVLRDNESGSIRIRD